MATGDTTSPRPKVAAAGIAGAVTIVLVALAEASGINVEPEVASSLTTVIAFLAGYLKRE